MTTRTPAPRFDLIAEPAAVRRINMTLACTDADALPKVDGAGSIFEHDGISVQRMHNGLLIEEGCYSGQWMTEVIRSLHGHHEPQEEVVFDAMVKRLARDTASPSMIEFGSFWTYYGMWFVRELAGGRTVAMEPDPGNLEVGRRNARLNDLDARIDFVHGAIGDRPGEYFEFEAESDGRRYKVEQYDLESLMRATDMSRADLVLVDVQGAEAVLLPRAADEFSRGQVRFILVSTHHSSISGDPLTHQKCLELLVNAGAHIIAEHSVSESYSGDGLIAASFDERDADMAVEISRARSKDSLFGEVEFEVNHLQVQLEEARADLARETDELERIRHSRVWRWSAPVRLLVSRLRRLLSRSAASD